MYTVNELLFPRYVIPSLRNLRGAAWAELVDRVWALDECHAESLAFMLMMIRLNGCMSCETDSFRAMRGCATCAQQMLRRYKGTDDDLLALFERALDDIRRHAAQSPDFHITGG
ncbi:MAG: hypothetical protein EA396_06710 [Anaerolineaceae bacterium]|nr:MAG: hypothetical protein EA396_06710 [Anaerolineaceae bacterium]